MNDLKRCLKGSFPFLETSETLWEMFAEAFGRAFTNSQSEEDAYDKLLKLKMTPGQLDAYIADFERLRTDAGWDNEQKGSVRIFKDGLIPSLANACMNCDSWPTTVKEWIVAAQE